MKEDAAGNIWFCTFDRDKTSGVVVLYNPSTSEIISHFTTKDGLSHNHVSSVTIEELGKIWFGTNKMTLSRLLKTFPNYYSE